MAKAATFVETFSAPLNTATWEYFGGTAASSRISVVDSRLAIPATIEYFGVRSQATWDLTSSSVFVQMLVPFPGTLAGTGANQSLFYVSDASNRYAVDNSIMCVVSGGILELQTRTAGVLAIQTIGAYSPHVYGTYFRLRHTTGSTIALDTSFDASLWTQRGTATASWNLVSSLVSLGAGRFDAAETSPGTAYFDNLNTAPAAPSVVTAWQSATSFDSLSLGWTTSNVTSARGLLSTASDLSNPVYSEYLTPSASGNVTCRFTGLTPSTMYYVGIETHGTLQASSGRGNYRTLKPQLGSSQVIAGSCNQTGSTSTVFTQIKTQAPDFFTHMGDIHYEDTNVESTWRAALRSTLESTTFRSMLQTVPMTYDWDNHDAGGSGSDGDDGWATFAPGVVRELTGTAHYPDSRGLYRTWVHAGVRYIELDRWTFRDNESVVDSPSKSMLGLVQREWLIRLLQTASEPAIVIFAGFPLYSYALANGRWGSYPHERDIIGNAISALPPIQKNKIVAISGDSHAIHADDGTNAMWGIPNLCASPLHQSGSGNGAGQWNIGNIDADDTRGYFSRLAFTPTDVKTPVETSRNYANNPRGVSGGWVQNGGTTTYLTGLTSPWPLATAGKVTPTGQWTEYGFGFIPTVAVQTSATLRFYAATDAGHASTGWAPQNLSTNQLLTSALYAPGSFLKSGVVQGTQHVPAGAAGAWYEVRFTIPANTPSFRVGLKEIGGITGAPISITAISVELTPSISTFFDGDTTDDADQTVLGALSYAWTGTANQSPSTKSVVKVTDVNLNMVWDAVRDDGVSVMTWSKAFSTSADRTGWIKDPTRSAGRVPFTRRRNPTETPNFVDGGTVSSAEWVEPQGGGIPTYDAGVPTPADSYETIFDGGGVSG